MNTSVEALENDGSKPNDLTPPKEASQESQRNEAPKNEVQRNEAQKETSQSNQTPKEMKVKSISYIGLSYMSDMLANEIVKIRVGDIVDSKKMTPLFWLCSIKGILKTFMPLLKAAY